MFTLNFKKYSHSEECIGAVHISCSFFHSCCLAYNRLVRELWLGIKADHNTKMSVFSFSFIIFCYHFSWHFNWMIQLFNSRSFTGNNSILPVTIRFSQIFHSPYLLIVTKLQLSFYRFSMLASVDKPNMCWIVG